MDKSRCVTCSERGRCKDSVASFLFFLVGIFSTIAVRLVPSLMHLDQRYGKVAWYIGIIGFLAFFIYKCIIGHQRAAIIAKQNLIHKIDIEKRLDDADYKMLSDMLCAISSRKERINYIFIAALSFLAILVAVYMDFLL